jgi:Mn2+/Fe2+ NRAMP family transporter
MRLLELQHHPHRRLLRGHGYFKRLGPGIVTGAADDDPSGIGTYSQVGAAFGFGLLWTTLATLPLAVAVQEATARLGLVTGKGLAALIRERFTRPVLVVVPRVHADRASLAALLAVFGTTISPYLFFWQAERRSRSRPNATTWWTATTWRRCGWTSWPGWVQAWA